MVDEVFRRALATRYQLVKSQYPTEGRRKWRLRVLYASWDSFVSDNIVSEAGQADSDALYEKDPDPLDSLLEDEELGLIIRTDFSNDDAWNSFCQKVQDAQKDLLSDLSNGDAEASKSSAAGGDGDVPMADSSSSTTATANADPDDSDSSSDSAPEIIKILNPEDSADRLRLTNISNLSALRLFNDVDVRPAPMPLPNTKRISPSNPLIDQGGWQEIYKGKNLWIYDTKSITDECVRVVSQEGDFYGTATGDSWRARGTHVPELQFSMSYHGMKIDFNGLDKWDWAERERNSKEYNIL